MSTGGSYEKQNRKDQEPTLTSKSSGINYLENSIQRSSTNGMGERPASTKNDGKKG